MQQLTDHYQGKSVLVTGHTGFKGSWLCAWLKMLGASVTGLSLDPSDERPNLFNAATISSGMTSCIGNICDADIVHQAFQTSRPSIVFHLAAQSLVRPSYLDPANTYATNVLGTVNVLEAARACPDVKTILVITTDKCYENKEWLWAYRENDRLGGKDPYSASKACAELVVKSYQESLLPLDGGRIRLASARGGNVIGGGDWSVDRLVPDLVTALQNKQPITLRNPDATRPWQHVLELLYGYLRLGEKLNENENFVGSWNFGPENSNEISVGTLTKLFIEHWGADVPVELQTAKLKEAQFLRLDSSKAQALLDWHPVLNLNQTISMTAEWYKSFFQYPTRAADFMNDQITKYAAVL